MILRLFCLRYGNFLCAFAQPAPPSHPPPLYLKLVYIYIYCIDELNAGISKKEKNSPGISTARNHTAYPHRRRRRRRRRCLLVNVTVTA